jgi:hypothetical protein
MGGASMQSGRRTFIEGNSHRDEAGWKAELEELVDGRLAENTDIGLESASNAVCVLTQFISVKINRIGLGALSPTKIAVRKWSMKPF